jgi:hypothetical protein
MTGTEYDGTEHDGTEQDGTEHDATEQHGTEQDGSALDGNALDGDALDGNALDGNALDGTELDGNALAGPLREVFAVELTAALGTCAGCGRSGPLAEARLYARAPGLVARCPGCAAVLVRLVAGPDRTWLDLRGLAVVEVPAGP